MSDTLTPEEMARLEEILGESDCPFELRAREGQCQEPEPLTVHLWPTRWNWLAGLALRLAFWIGRYEGSAG